LVGDEPPLSYRVDALDPSDPVEPSILTQQVTGEPTSGRIPSSPLAPLVDDDVECADVGSPPFNNKLDRRF
jgi:hypothetical protein